MSEEMYIYYNEEPDKKREPHYNVARIAEAYQKIKNMKYTPIEEADKEKWIDWLTSQQNVLNSKREDPDYNKIFETPDGDVAVGKDLVGNLLALLTNQTIEIK